jgi:hypothetical protein
MKKLTYPTLDLFLYDLREGLGQSEADIQQNRDNFKQKLPKTIDENRFIQLDEKYFEPEYVELLGNEQRYSDFESETHDGYYYPVRLSDSYGLLLDCSLKKPQPEADLSWLNELQACLNNKLQGQTGALGQTWMFSAQLPYVPIEEYEAIAKRCYEALIPGANYAENQLGYSDFLDGRLFELWCYTSPEQISENHHLIIALYPNEQTAKRAATEFYTDWMRLLMYRHKMMWAYNQSRLLKKQLKAGAVDIQAYRQQLNPYHAKSVNHKRLQKNLSQAWQTFSEYTAELNWLDSQARTIEINLHNYQTRLKRIEEKAGQPLNCLEKFSHSVQTKYLLQVQKDHANFTPSLNLLGSLIESVRAKVAIERERRELQDTFALLGFALATGAIVASISGHFPTSTLEAALDNPIGAYLAEHIPKAWIPPSISIALSIGAALVAGIVTKLVMWLWHR